MNRLMTKRSAKNLTLLTLFGMAAAQSAWAQTPPGWLNWSDKSGAAPTAAAQTPAAGSQTATPQPLGQQQPLGASEAGANSASGQAVIIQNLLDSVSSLQEQVRDLRGQNEVQENQIQRLQKAQQSAFSSFDDRLLKLEQPGGSASAPVHRLHRFHQRPSDEGSRRSCADGASANFPCANSTCTCGAHSARTCLRSGCSGQCKTTGSV